MQIGTRDANAAAKWQHFRSGHRFADLDYTVARCERLAARAASLMGGGTVEAH